MKQSDIIFATEGDAYYERNKDKPRDDDPVLAEILSNPRIRPLSVLEVGCGSGWRLNKLSLEHRHSLPYEGTTYSGADLSWQAIHDGKAKYRDKINLRVAPAESLGYVAESFDLVIMAFFMYLVDREDLFKVVAEMDRVLKDGGALVLHDFTLEGSAPHSAYYKHEPKLKTFKMNYWLLFIANPAYTVEQFKLLPGGEAIVTMRKNVAKAWPLS